MSQPFNQITARLSNHTDMNSYRYSFRILFLRFWLMQIKPHTYNTQRQIDTLTHNTRTKTHVPKQKSLSTKALNPQINLNRSPIFTYQMFNSKKWSTTKRQFTFNHTLPWSSWYSDDETQKDERLSHSWSHPVALSP